MVAVVGEVEDFDGVASCACPGTVIIRGGRWGDFENGTWCEPGVKVSVVEVRKAWRRSGGRSIWVDKCDEDRSGAKLGGWRWGEWF